MSVNFWTSLILLLSKVEVVVVALVLKESSSLFSWNLCFTSQSVMNSEACLIFLTTFSLSGSWGGYTLGVGRIHPWISFQFITGHYMRICRFASLIKGTFQCSEGVLATEMLWETTFFSSLGEGSVVSTTLNLMNRLGSWAYIYYSVPIHTGSYNTAAELATEIC